MRCYDGDTCTTYRKENIRLACIDAPEIGSGSAAIRAKNKITDLSNKKIEAQKVLVKALTPILAEYSKNNSISYIIPKQNIIIGNSELDLTKTILEILVSKVKNIELK